MNLFDAYNSGTPLKVQSPNGGQRVIAGLVAVDGGLMFADVYWREPGRHPFHILRGPVTGVGPWTVGDNEISVIEDGDSMAAEWNDWIAVRGPAIVDKAAVEAAMKKSELFLDIGS